MPSRLQPCESKLTYYALKLPLRSPLLTMILWSILATSFFCQPLVVHSFSATASKAGSNTTQIFLYCSSRPSSYLNSRHLRIESSCASAFVSTRSIASTLASLKSIWCLSQDCFSEKSLSIYCVPETRLLTSISIFWFSYLAAWNFSSKQAQCS